jgi:hypothetical protein
MTDSHAKPLPKWVAVQDRESGQWAVLGQCKWHSTPIRDPWSGRKKGVRRYQYDWDHGFPVKYSPFFKTHRIVEANTQEEALCLAQRSS